MVINPEFELIIHSYPESIRELASRTRNSVLKVLPGAIECPWPKLKVIGYGTGPKRNTEHFCWIAPAKAHVTIGFNYGAELPDPNKLMEGSGKVFRHVKLKSIKDLENPALLDLLKFASSYKIPPLQRK